MVDLDAFAIQNQFELSSPGGDGTDAVALIDIGASVMKTNVIHAGACIFARDVPFGGNNYTDAIAQRLNVSTEMAEAAKQGREVGVNWDDLVPALEAVSRELSLEVQRTFDYFASTAESERIGKIVLSGGCAKLTGLDDFLGLVLGCAGRAGPPLPGHRARRRSVRRRRSRADRPRSGGGGRTRPSPPGRQAGMIKVNLAPPTTKRPRRAAASGPELNLGLLFGGILAVLVLIIGGWWLTMSLESDGSPRRSTTTSVNSSGSSPSSRPGSDTGGSVTSWSGG